MDETLRHLRRFRSQGVSELVLTPHLLAADLAVSAMDEVLALHRERFGEVLDAVGEDPAFPRLSLGQEVLARTPGDVEKVVGRPDVGLAGGPALLVDLGLDQPFDGDGVVQRVVAEGRMLIIAHPERYDFGQDDAVEVVTRWRDRGALLQINGGSPADLYTPAASSLAKRFLEEGVVDMVCTDHHGDFRSHDPGMIAETLAPLTGSESVELLMGQGPRRVLPASAARSVA